MFTAPMAEMTPQTIEYEGVLVIGVVITVTFPLDAHVRTYFKLTLKPDLSINTQFSEKSISVMFYFSIRPNLLLNTYCYFLFLAENYPFFMIRL